MKQNFGILALVLGSFRLGLSQPELDWIQTYGDTISGYYIISLTESDEGGYYLGGFLGLGGEAWHTLMKTDAEGRIEWESEVESEMPKYAESVLALPDNQVVASGGIVSAGGYWVTSYGDDGRILWSYFDRNSGSSCNLLKTSDGDIISCSSVLPENYPDSSKVRLMWITPEGERYRIKDYQFEGNSQPIKLFETAEGYELIIGGNNVGDFSRILHVSNEGDSLHITLLETTEPWPIKLVRLADGSYILPRLEQMALSFGLTFFGSQGDSITTRIYDVNFDEFHVLHGIIFETDESLTLYGSSEDFPFLMRINQEGETQWVVRYETHQTMRNANVCIKTRDGGYLLLDTRWFSGQTYLLKTTNDTLSAPAAFPLHPSSFILHPCFPNPFNSSITITYDVARPGFVRLGVYDALGRLVGKVKEGYAVPGSYQAIWNGEGQSSGNYFVKFQSGGDTSPIIITYMK